MKHFCLFVPLTEVIKRFNSMVTAYNSATLATGDQADWRRQRDGHDLHDSAAPLTSFDSG
jgi:hypothetical protein